MKLLRYLTQYRIRDMQDFIRNEKASPAHCDVSLNGKTVLITGATSGIGLETARLFAAKGATLICCNRSQEKSAHLTNELKEKYGTPVETILADFSSMENTKACAAAILAIEKPIDIYIFNAGVYFTRKTFTADGLEVVFQVNHLSAFCLNYLLKEKIRQENLARIVFVNSEGHRFALGGVHIDDLAWRRHIYTGLKSYGAAKTAQILVMRKFVQYFSGTSVTVNAMHPGNVRSHMGENNGPLYRSFKEKFILRSARNPEISAQALYFLAASERMRDVSGKFFNLTTEEKPAPHALDVSMVEPLWQKSIELCGLA